MQTFCETFCGVCSAFRSDFCKAAALRDVCAAFRCAQCNKTQQKALNIHLPAEASASKALASSPRQPRAVAMVPEARRTIMVASRHGRRPLRGPEAPDSSRLRLCSFLSSAISQDPHGRGQDVCKSSAPTPINTSLGIDKDAGGSYQGRPVRPPPRRGHLS